MFSATDRIYFIDPVQAPTTDLPEDAHIVVTDTPDSSEDAPYGHVVEVNGVATDGYGRTWYTDEHGNRYDGALINEPYRTRMLIGWYGDITVLGNRVAIIDNRTILSRSLRSDQRVFGQGGDMRVSSVTQAVKAAPWATALFPQPEDTPAVVIAKIDQARAKWHHRRKHAFLLREAMQRGWFNYLEEGGFFTEHGMPRPKWNALVEGMAKVSTGASRSVSAATALENNPAVAAALGRMQPPVQRDEHVVTEVVNVPFRTTLTLDRDYENRVAVTEDTTLIREVQNKLNDDSAVITITNARPILSSVTAS